VNRVNALNVPRVSVASPNPQPRHPKRPTDRVWSPRFNSIFGTAGSSCSIISAKSSGFAECVPISASTGPHCVPGRWRRDLAARPDHQKPVHASQPTTEPDLVFEPNGVGLYVNPHAARTTRASGNIRRIAHKNSTQSLAAIDGTSRALIASMVVLPVIRRRRSAGA
jgi:hypothetical protein